MTLFTEGRLQAFERMMQDTGKYPVSYTHLDVYKRQLLLLRKFQDYMPLYIQAAFRFP